MIMQDEHAQPHHGKFRARIGEPVAADFEPKENDLDE
jgi:hypothetical protein